MKFINKLERKFGKYAIHNLIIYIIALYVLGIFVYMVAPFGFYQEYLMLDIDKVLQGQVWRLITFLIQPVFRMNLFVVFELYLYYIIGRSLENAWGAFRFNLYFISGILFNVLAVVVIYLITKSVYGVGISYYIDLTYVNRSMFFAFAALFPNMELLFMFILPIKIKYFAYLYGAIIGYDVLRFLSAPQLQFKLQGIAILFALANFIIFFFGTRNFRRISPNEIRRKQKFKKQMKSASYGNVTQFRGKTVVTRHKCAVCGRTELDDDNLEFRFCSKCDGNYEYCMDHLFTHEHVKH